MMALLLLAAAISQPALAGRLDTGWRSATYGPEANIDEKPGGDCVRDPEPKVRWRCAEKVGDAQVVASYFVDEGWFFGVSIRAAGFSACSIVFDTISAAWADTVFVPKEYATGALLDGWWGIAGATSASWSWNTYSGACSVVTLNAEACGDDKAGRARRAAPAAGAL